MPPLCPVALNGIARLPDFATPRAFALTEDRGTLSSACFGLFQDRPSCRDGFGQPDKRFGWDEESSGCCVMVVFMMTMGIFVKGCS